MTETASIESLPAGLVYVSDDMPGIVRRRRGRGFAYLDAAGRPVGAGERARCAALGIPPAWEQVWICAEPAGHLQSTGYDAAGRKQYRYHPAWSAWRSEAKYACLAAFGRGLARFRAGVERDLAGEPGAQEVSLAAIAVLLDRLHLRAGSAAYAARNRTFGATTLQTRHLRLEGGLLRLRYRAKGGRLTEHSLRDARLHRIFEAIHDLPGRDLFVWIDADGDVRRIGSQHLNRYLAERTGVEGATAKTFRTWAGTMAAFGVACRAKGPLSLRTMAEAAAERLHNTPAIARAAYIHPAVLGLAALDPVARRERLLRLQPAGPLRLRAGERRLIGLLEAGDG
ncbi:MAG TPA: DNA topoisomerase IB [Amaricoccus sp.]|nr:DNA topoisomerase IB [Amaricoccus sp.]